MRTEKVYVCEVCESRFPEPGPANLCEASHVKTRNMNANNFKVSHVHDPTPGHNSPNGYPLVIAVRRSDALGNADYKLVD